MTFTLGENVGAYRIVEQLGQGGMATVYKAYHAALDRYVAIKVMHLAFKEDKTFLARFQREARVVARLEHRHIVPVYDYAEHNGSPFLVMKFIEGETLKARLERGPLSLSEIKRVVEAVGAGLDYAHRRGILHRDIKPSNVMLGEEGAIYIADFGLARIAMAGESTISMDSLLGTPHYMSPEQAKGIKDIDAGTDIYSFGVVIYELLVGRVPYSADTPFAIIHDHIFTPLPLPRAINPQVSEAQERFLLKALAKERADRYADAPALVKAFQETCTGDLGRVETPAPGPAQMELNAPTVIVPAAVSDVEATVIASLPVSRTAPPEQEQGTAEAATVIEPAARPAPIKPAGKKLSRWLALGGVGLVGLVALLAGIGLLGPRLIKRAATVEGTVTPKAVNLVGPSATPATVKPAVEGTPVTVRWIVWSGERENPIESAVAADFNATHSDIKLVVEFSPSGEDERREALHKLLIADSQETYIVGPMGVEHSALYFGQWLDLSPYLKDYDYSDFEPRLVDFYAWPHQGRIGIPFLVYPSFIYYNRTLFDKAGVPYPPQRFGEEYNGRPWNLETFSDLALRLTVDQNGRRADQSGFDASRIAQFGYIDQFGNAQHAPAFFGPASLVSDDFRLAQTPPNWREFWRWYHAGIWDKHFIPGANAEQVNVTGNSFGSGKIAMAFAPLWYTCCIQPDAANWDIAVVPAVHDRTTAPIDADSFYIPKASAHPAEAFIVLDYLVGEAASKLVYFYGMPARRSLRPAYFQEITARFAPNDVHWPVVEDSLAYLDIPSHEAALPNYGRTQERLNEFYMLVRSQPDLDIEAELDRLTKDLQKIYDAAP